MSLGALDILQKQLSFIRQLVIVDFLPFLFGSSTVIFPLQKTVWNFPQFSLALPKIAELTKPRPKGFSVANPISVNILYYWRHWHWK